MKKINGWDYILVNQEDQTVTEFDLSRSQYCTSYEWRTDIGGYWTISGETRRLEHPVTDAHGIQFKWDPAVQGYIGKCPATPLSLDFDQATDMLFHGSSTSQQAFHKYTDLGFSVSQAHTLVDLNKTLRKGILRKDIKKDYSPPKMVMLAGNHSTAGDKDLQGVFSSIPEACNGLKEKLITRIENGLSIKEAYGILRNRHFTMQEIVLDDPAAVPRDIDPAEEFEMFGWSTDGFLSDVFELNDDYIWDTSLVKQTIFTPKELATYPAVKRYAAGNNKAKYNICTQTQDGQVRYSPKSMSRDMAATRVAAARELFPNSDRIWIEVAESRFCHSDRHGDAIATGLDSPEDAMNESSIENEGAGNSPGM